MSRSTLSRLVKLSHELQALQGQSPSSRSRGSRARHREIRRELLGHRRDSGALRRFGPRQVCPQDYEAQELGPLLALRSSNDPLEDEHHRRKIASHGCMHRFEVTQSFPSFHSGEIQRPRAYAGTGIAETSPATTWHAVMIGEPLKRGGHPRTHRARSSVDASPARQMRPPPSTA